MDMVYSSAGEPLDFATFPRRIRICFELRIKGTDLRLPSTLVDHGHLDFDRDRRYAKPLRISL